ncbi:ribosome hibernation-promoting factor, HPF/YfiA family [Heliophilum fasciatum]|uniref:Ribosome hibernation promoting factor n=1 Tax=Heliophilum fasciatum TaxID=35700 RepID=A0A4R2RFG6_9FIRM|nr:ribosome-associated translation inhibitor RaiA [Heliophilum fasciatum]MCW2279230.1 putative sigma-54 modulation protein [Heliophilum fasciatum]TCP60817.1 SSU ribosomal protein S30P /sigma 54 modulation protein [Heliophilum fasciatum]
MNIQVRGKNIEVTQALKEYVVKRLSKLEKYINSLGDARVSLSVEGDRHRVEVTVPAADMLLRAEESHADMYAAIDLVFEKLEKQIGAYKTKLQRRTKHASPREVAPPLDDLGTAVADDEPRIVRSKRFAFKPMPVDEAVMQMNLIGHSFFVFANSETEQVSVVYRRKDGNYGLIEPDFD